MRSRNKNRTKGENHYWQSYSDMCAALLLIFILMIAITLSIYKQKNQDLENTKLDLDSAKQELDLARIDLENTKLDLESAMLDLESYRKEIEDSNRELESSLAQLQEAYAQAALTEDELKQAYLEIDNAKTELKNTKEELESIVGIRTDIIGELQNTFQNSDMVVDAQTGSISFPSDVLFSVNSSTLNQASQASLKKIIPMYLEVLLQDRFRDYIAEIIIEGHTDTNGSYVTNMELSYNRASSVALFCLNPKNGLSEQKIAQLQELLTVNGRSYSDPVYVKNTTGDNQQKVVDMAASRRVEIKFRLKEEEMIEKITEVLSKEQ